MAAGTTAQVLDHIGELHLECPICTNRFREPKMLNCLHSFCLECLQDILRKGQDSSRRMLKCPACRRETILIGNGVADLPNDRTLSALVEEFAVQEKLLEGKGSEIICQGCGENNQASSFCMDCAHFLCQECKRAHERMTIMQSHKVYTLAQLQSREVTYKSKLREVPKCLQHPDQNLNVYCNTCQKLICTTCSVLDHETHSRSGLSVALDECKREIAELVAKVEESMAALSTAVKDTENACKKLHTMFAGTVQKISTKTDKEVDTIRARGLKLTQAAEKIHKDRVKTLETVQAANSKGVKQAKDTLDEVNHLMSQASCCEILNLKQKLLDNLKDITDQEPDKVPDKLSFMDFQDEGSLGRLVLKDEWNLQTQIPIKKPGSKQQEFRYVHDVTAFSNGEIVTVDRERKRLSYFVPTSNPLAPFISQELKMEDLKDPTHVAVNKADQLIVLDGDAVKTLSRGYQLLNQFRPGEKSNSKPTCLAVDDNNLIAVGYKDKEEISLHKPDGSLIRRLQAPKIGNHLTISMEQFIYIDRTVRKVQSVDHNGVTLFQVDVPVGGRNPRDYVSVCCDSLGSMYMYIAEPTNSLYTCVFQKKYKILQLSPGGRHFRTIIRNAGHPHSITFTATGDLVVGAEHAIQIYRHV